MNEECITALLSRRSVRKFKDESVPETDLERILEAGFSAPSAGNRQPWRVVVVRNEGTRNRLSRAAYDQEFIAEAPVVLVVCAVPSESAERYRERGRTLYVLQDTAALTENILLAAHIIGYGACWIGAFDEDLARSVVSVPDDMRPVAIIPIGKPSRPAPGRRSRRALSEVVVWESF
ncbi:MAG: nitroreductase family protein [Candidatus Thorarchaeota archaeon]|nr:MAG: nitroreductase family protein [Candidatus Thorarchaeota archaeon]